VTRSICPASEVAREPTTPLSAAPACIQPQNYFSESRAADTALPDVTCAPRLCGARSMPWRATYSVLPAVFVVCAYVVKFGRRRDAAVHHLRVEVRTAYQLRAARAHVRASRRCTSNGRRDAHIDRNKDRRRIKRTSLKRLRSL
jgi:hypothetical protein